MKNVSMIVVLLIAIIFAPIPSVHAQWMRTYGPYGAAISAIGNIGTIQFVSTQSGLFRSTNEGTDWVRVGALSIGCNILSMATVGATLFVAPYMGGVLASRDSGRTWDSVYSGMTNFYDNAPLEIIGLTTNNACLYAATRFNGVFRTSDSGKHWSQTGAEFERDQAGNVNATALGNTGAYVYAVFDGALYRSDSGGAIWTNTNLPAANLSWVSFVTIGQYLFVGTSDGLYRTGLNGNGFIKMATSATIASVNALASNSSLLFIATSQGILLSSDFGTTMQSISAGLPDNVTITSLSCIGDTLLAGTDAGIYRSHNGVGWALASKGLNYAPVSSLVVDSTYVLSCTKNGIYRTANKGDVWDRIGGGWSLGTTVTSLATIGSNLFVGTDQHWSDDPGDVFRSTDNGDTWVRASDGLTNPSVSDLWNVDSLLFAIDWVGGCSPWQEMSRSTNEGATWTRCDSIRLDVTTSHTTLGGYLFVGVESYYGTIFRSSNQGATWSESDNGMRAPVGSNPSPDWSAVAALLTIGNRLVAITDHGDFVSTDTGSSWTKSNYLSGIFGYPSTILTIGDVLIGASYCGVYASIDTGTTWVKVENGLNDTHVSGMVISDTTLFVGTSTGVWRRGISEVVTVAQHGIDKGQVQAGVDGDGNMHPDNSAVLVYPNPTTGTVTIELGTTNIEEVIITNLLGQSVIEISKPGTPSFTLDLSKLPAGTYFATISTDGSLITKRIVKE